MYNDYKEKLIDSNQQEREVKLDDSYELNDNKVATYYKDFKEKNSKEDAEDNDSKSTPDDSEAQPKKIFKKLKTKVKGDKENVLKTIKLKLK